MGLETSGSSRVFPPFPVCKNIEYELLLVPLLEIISSTYHITKYYIVLNPLVVGHKLIKYYHKT